MKRDFASLRQRRRYSAAVHRGWLSYYENMIRNRHVDRIVWGKSFRWGPPMTVQHDRDNHSDYGPAQLALFGVAAFVLLVFVWIVIP